MVGVIAASLMLLHMIDSGTITIPKVVLIKVNFLHYNMSHYVIVIEFFFFFGYNDQIVMLLINVLLCNDKATQNCVVEILIPF